MELKQEITDYKTDFVNALNIMAEKKGRGINTAIANAVGVDPSQISRARLGTAGNEKLRRQIAQYFGYDYHDFLLIGKKGKEIKTDKREKIDELLGRLEEMRKMLEQLMLEKD